MHFQQFARVQEEERLRRHVLAVRVLFFYQQRGKKVSDKAIETDIRWKQRLHNYKLALTQLRNAVEIGKQRKYSDLETQGLIQAFEFTHELAWKLIKDYLSYQGNDQMISGSRDATKEAFKLGIISDGEDWMQMIESLSLIHI